MAEEIKKQIKLSSKLEKIAKEIEGLTVIELADLSSYLEDKFGVTAMPAAVAAPITASQEEKKEEKSTFTVVLKTMGDKKLAVIKAVREILPNLGLMDAKKLVESAPKDLLVDVKKEEAEEAKKKIETAGGTVELK